MEYKDLEFFRKSSKTYELIFEKNGISEDITGWSIYLTVKENMEDTDTNAKISKTVTVHSEPTNGKTLISLTSSDTDILAGMYWYSIDYKDNLGNEGVLFWGKLRTKEPVRKIRV